MLQQRLTQPIVTCLFLCSLVRSEVWQSHETQSHAWGGVNRWGQSYQANSNQKRWSQTRTQSLDHQTTSPYQYEANNAQNNKKITIIGHGQEIFDIINELKARSRKKDIEATFLINKNNQYTTIERFDTDSHLLKSLLQYYHLYEHLNEDYYDKFNYKVPVCHDDLVMIPNKKEAEFIIGRTGLNNNIVDEQHTYNNNYKAKVFYNNLHNHYEIHVPPEKHIVGSPIHIKLKIPAYNNAQKCQDHIFTKLEQENNVPYKSINVFGAEDKSKQNIITYYNENQMNSNYGNSYHTTNLGSYEQDANLHDNNNEYNLGPLNNNKVNYYIHNSKPIHYYNKGVIVPALPSNDNPNMVSKVKVNKETYNLNSDFGSRIPNNVYNNANNLHYSTNLNLGNNRNNNYKSYNLESRRGSYMSKVKGLDYSSRADSLSISDTKNIPCEYKIDYQINRNAANSMALTKGISNDGILSKYYNVNKQNTNNGIANIEHSLYSMPDSCLYKNLLMADSGYTKNINFQIPKTNYNYNQPPKMYSNINLNIKPIYGKRIKWLDNKNILRNWYSNFGKTINKLKNLSNYLPCLNKSANNNEIKKLTSQTNQNATFNYKPKTSSSLNSMKFLITPTYLNNADYNQIGYTQDVGQSSSLNVNPLYNSYTLATQNSFKATKPTDLNPKASFYKGWNTSPVPQNNKINVFSKQFTGTPNYFQTTPTYNYQQAIVTNEPLHQQSLLEPTVKYYTPKPEISKLSENSHKYSSTEATIKVTPISTLTKSPNNQYNPLTQGVSSKISAPNSKAYPEIPLNTKYVRENALNFLNPFVQHYPCTQTQSGKPSNSYTKENDYKINTPIQNLNIPKTSSFLQKPYILPISFTSPVSNYKYNFPGQGETNKSFSNMFPFQPSSPTCALYQHKAFVYQHPCQNNYYPTYKTLEYISKPDVQSVPRHYAHPSLNYNLTPFTFSGQQFDKNYQKTKTGHHEFISQGVPSSLNVFVSSNTSPHLNTVRNPEPLNQYEVPNYAYWSMITKANPKISTQSLNEQKVIVEYKPASTDNETSISEIAQKANNLLKSGYKHSQDFIDIYKRPCNKYVIINNGPAHYMSDNILSPKYYNNINSYGKATSTIPKEMSYSNPYNVRLYPFGSNTKIANTNNDEYMPYNNKNNFKYNFQKNQYWNWKNTPCSTVKDTKESVMKNNIPKTVPFKNDYLAFMPTLQFQPQKYRNVNYLTPQATYIPQPKSQTNEPTSKYNYFNNISPFTMEKSDRTIKTNKNIWKLWRPFGRSTLKSIEKNNLFTSLPWSNNNEGTYNSNSFNNESPFTVQASNARINTNKNNWNWWQPLGIQSMKENDKNKNYGNLLWSKNNVGTYNLKSSTSYIDMPLDKTKSKIYQLTDIKPLKPTPNVLAATYKPSYSFTPNNNAYITPGNAKYNSNINNKYFSNRGIYDGNVGQQQTKPHSFNDAESQPPFTYSYKPFKSYFAKNESSNIPFYAYSGDNAANLIIDSYKPVTPRFNSISSPSKTLDDNLPISYPSHNRATENHAIYAPFESKSLTIQLPEKIIDNGSDTVLTNTRENLGNAFIPSSFISKGVFSYPLYKPNYYTAQHYTKKASVESSFKNDGKTYSANADINIIGTLEPALSIATTPGHMPFTKLAVSYLNPTNSGFFNVKAFSPKVILNNKKVPYNVNNYYQINSELTSGKQLNIQPKYTTSYSFDSYYKPQISQFNKFGNQDITSYKPFLENIPRNRPTCKLPKYDPVVKASPATLTNYPLQVFYTNFKHLNGPRVSINSFPTAKLFYNTIDNNIDSKALPNYVASSLNTLPMKSTSHYQKYHPFPKSYSSYNEIPKTPKLIGNSGRVNYFKPTVYSANAVELQPQNILNPSPFVNEINNPIQSTNVNNVVTEEIKRRCLSEKFINKLQNLCSPLSIDLGVIGIAKYVPDSCEKQFILKTNDPNVEIKAWQSKLKVIKPKIVFDIGEVGVVNFVPIIKCNFNADYEYIQNLVKGVISNKYGEPIIVKDFINCDPYAVMCDVNSIDLVNNNFNVLWPTYDGNYCRNAHSNFVIR